MSQSKNFNGFEVPITCEEERLYLSIQHAHPRDSLIAFAETIPNSDEHHKYFIRGNKEYCSVSEFYKQFFQEFDKKEVALKMLQRDDFYLNKKYSDYWPLVKDKTLSESIEIIIKYWEDNGDEQSNLGTIMHRKIELYLNNSIARFDDTKEQDFNQITGTHVNDDKREPDTNEFSHFLQLYSDLQSNGLQVFRTEMMMFDDESKLCGCADVIFIDKMQDITIWPTQKLKVHLGDWKRSKKIKKSGYGKFGKFVCDALPDSNYYHYSLQLNLYKYILEKHYDFIVESMTMYVFHPDNNSYLEFPVQDYQPLISKMIQLRIDHGFKKIIEPKTVFIRKRKTHGSQFVGCIDWKT
jgi:hypothetical protein